MGYRYSTSYAPSGRAQCRECGQLISKDSVRITRETEPIEHLNGHTITNHFHYKHVFDAMRRSNCKSNTITNTKQLSNFSKLDPKDQTLVKKQIDKFAKAWNTRCSKRTTRRSTRRRTRRTRTRA
jgi:hypothetical protein